MPRPWLFWTGSITPIIGGSIKAIIDTKLSIWICERSARTSPEPDVEFEDVAAPAAAKTMEEIFFRGDDKRRGFVLVIREGAPAHIAFAVLFECAAAGLFDIGF